MIVLISKGYSYMKVPTLIHPFIHHSFIIHPSINPSIIHPSFIHQSSINPSIHSFIQLTALLLAAAAPNAVKAAATIICKP